MHARKEAEKRGRTDQLVPSLFLVLRPLQTAPLGARRVDHRWSGRAQARWDVSHGKGWLAQLDAIPYIDMVVLAALLSTGMTLILGDVCVAMGATSAIQLPTRGHSHACGRR